MGITLVCPHHERRRDQISQLAREHSSCTLQYDCPYYGDVPRGVRGPSPPLPSTVGCAPGSMGLHVDGGCSSGQLGRPDIEIRAPLTHTSCMCHCHPRRQSHTLPRHQGALLSILTTGSHPSCTRIFSALCWPTSHASVMRSQLALPLSCAHSSQLLCLLSLFS